MRELRSGIRAALHKKLTPRPVLLDNGSMMSAHRVSSPLGRHCHNSCPVAASRAATSRFIPAVVYITPSTIRGLTCDAAGVLGPKFRVEKRHAT